MRILAEWHDCSLALVGEYPGICVEGVRRIKEADARAWGFGQDRPPHQHLVVKGRLGGFIWDSSKDKSA